MDALDSLVKDVRLIAKQVGEGHIKFPRQDNPSMTMDVKNGLIVKAVLHFGKGGKVQDVVYK
jgi:hypothetical protein